MPSPPPPFYQTSSSDVPGNLELSIRAALRLVHHHSPQAISIRGLSVWCLVLAAVCLNSLPLCLRLLWLASGLARASACSPAALSASRRPTPPHAAPRRLTATIRSFSPLLFRLLLPLRRRVAWRGVAWRGVAWREAAGVAATSCRWCGLWLWGAKGEGGGGGGGDVRAEWSDRIGMVIDGAADMLRSERIHERIWHVHYTLKVFVQYLYLY